MKKKFISNSFIKNIEMSSIGLNFFLEDKELKNKHELALPTNEMYRFFPPKEEIILSHTNPKKIIVLYLMVNQKQIMKKKSF